MDDSGHCENGRQKQHQGQWLMQHQPSMKQIRRSWLKGMQPFKKGTWRYLKKKAALAERDMAILQRDSAIAERNSAIMERDNAITTLQYRENSMTNSNSMSSPCPLGCQISHSVKHIHHPQPYVQHQQHDMHLGGGDSLPVSPAAPEPAKSMKEFER